MITLDRYLRTGQRIDPGLIVALEQVALAVKRISNELAGAALKGELGYSGAINVQGEAVEKLDTWSDNVFVDTFSGGGPVCTLISEEMEEPRHFKAQCARYSYAVLYDPLDGSSNTDVNGALGTIFAVRRRKPGHGEGIEDVLAVGSEQIAAGYGLYGPATMLVWTAGDGVNAFVLGRGIGEFVLWREKIRMPERGKTYGVNQANAARWHPGARALLERLTGPKGQGRWLLAALLRRLGRRLPSLSAQRRNLPLPGRGERRRQEHLQATPDVRGRAALDAGRAGRRRRLDRTRARARSCPWPHP